MRSDAVEHRSSRIVRQLRSRMRSRNSGGRVGAGGAVLIRRRWSGVAVNSCSPSTSNRYVRQSLISGSGGKGRVLVDRTCVCRGCDDCLDRLGNRVAAGRTASTPRVVASAACTPSQIQSTRTTHVLVSVTSFELMARVLQCANIDCFCHMLL